MYTPIGTLIFYLFVFGLVLLLCHNGEKKNNRKQVKWAYVILGLVAFCRYDIGNDYAPTATSFVPMLENMLNTRNAFQTFTELDGRHEFSLVFFTWLFGFLKHPYVGVIGSYSIITIFFLYKALDRFPKAHSIGLFVFIVSEMLFNSWDWFRQSTAFAIILYALCFTDHKIPWKYILLVLFAMLFHNSAAIMLPMFLLKYLRINKIILFITLGAAMVAFFSGVFQKTLEQITALFGFVEGYESYATSKQGLETITSLGYVLRTILYAIFWGYIILTMPNDKAIFKNFLFIGVVIFTIASGSQIVTRLSFYFLFSGILAVPLTIRNEKGMNRLRGLKLQVLKGIFILVFFLFCRDIVTNNIRGCMPYDSILSNHYEMQWFRPKAY